MDLVGVDGEAQVRDPGWQGDIAEAPMHNEHGQERHPERSAYPPEPSVRHNGGFILMTVVQLLLALQEALAAGTGAQNRA